MKHFLRLLLLTLPFTASAQYPLALPATFSGNITTTDPSSPSSPDDNGTNAPNTTSNGTFYYEIISLPVSTAGSYTFATTAANMVSPGAFGGTSATTLYGTLYRRSFVAATPLVNALQASTAGANLNFTRTLAKGQYYLVLTGYQSQSRGTYSVRVSGAGPLPVELTRFTARTQGAGTVLAWNTASELNNAYFAVERSRDGRDFQPVGQVDGHGSSVQAHDYTWVDAAAPAGTAYYRLRQVDTDGAATFSPVQSVEHVAGEAQLSFSPNPVRSTATFFSPVATTLTVRDGLGRVCRVLPLPAGTQPVALEALPAGVYTLTDEGTHRTTHLVKAAE